MKTMMSRGGRIILDQLEQMDSPLLSPGSSGNSAPIHLYTVVVCGVFVLLTLSLSTFLIFEHLTCYKVPEEQKWIIGIIFMVPVYTVSSFVSLWKPKLSLVCGILGNCYEAWALYAFGSYLIACLGGEDRVVEYLEAEGTRGARTPLLQDKSDPLKGRKAEVEHPAPLSWCIDPWELGLDFYVAAKFGIVQYMLLKTLCAVAALILDQFGLYNEGNLFTANNGYPYITVILNFSQTWALYCLIQFYAQTHEALKEINPLGKFICFKSIVFATWWQGVIFSVVFGSGWVNLSEDDLSGNKFQTFLQNALVCLEMAVAAVAHIFVFPATPYQRMGHKRRPEPVKVLEDLANVDSPLDPDEVRESTKLSVVKFPEKADGGHKRRNSTSLRESFQEIVVVGGGHVVQDVKDTVHLAVEPIKNLNEQLPWAKIRKEGPQKEKKKKMSKDDFWVGSAAGLGHPVRGIDDPFLLGSISDSTIVRKKSTAYNSGAESSGESSSDQGPGFRTGGRRWTIKR